MVISQNLGHPIFGIWLLHLVCTCIAVSKKPLRIKTYGLKVQVHGAAVGVSRSLALQEFGKWARAGCTIAVRQHRLGLKFGMMRLGLEATLHGIKNFEDFGSAKKLEDEGKWFRVRVSGQVDFGPLLTKSQ